mmetsp:Transcript_26010/g.43853  ORF Transcript_26010/g.43853 Transcript_26010/m.43853 type:complete len:481 (-) Transcript_26010:196-1638(-)
MESSRPRGRSFVEDSPLPSPPATSGSSLDDDFQDGPVMYDPTLVFDDDGNDLDNDLNDIDDKNANKDDSYSNTNDDELNEEEYFSRGRSRSRSVHSNDDVAEDGKPKGLSEEELTARIEEAAKKNEKKESNRSTVVRTGALKQREVSALEKGLREATHQTKEEERIEEEAEKEAALREKEERSVSISNTAGRSSLAQTLSSPPGVDPPMRRVKILLLGDSSVGKSSLIHRITDNTFKHSLVATVGVDYKVRKLHINNENVQVQLWDTAGSEKFHKITQSYYRGVHGIMLVYDVSNRKSFRHVSYWLSNISKYANENVQVQLVGNKVDLRLETKKDPNAGINKFIKRTSKSADSLLVDEKAERDPFVQTYEGQNVANKYHINYTETSALSNTNIEESIAQCVKQVIHHMDNPNLISSLRDKLKKGDSKTKLNSSSNDARGRQSSGEKKLATDRKEEKVEAGPSSKSKGKDKESKDKDCVIS